jgi:hypothetical protein
MLSDNPHTFTSLLPELLEHHILPRLGFYDLWQLRQTAKRYARIIPMPWDYSNMEARYIASAPLKKVHAFIERSWSGHELNRQASYHNRNIKAFVRNPYHASVNTILVPYAKRYIGSCGGGEVDEASNLRRIFTHLLRYKSPARFLHEWEKRFPSEWNSLFDKALRHGYDQGTVLIKCLRRRDVLDVFSLLKTPLPLSFTATLWDWLPNHLTPPLNYSIFERNKKASKGFLALVEHNKDFRAMVEEKIVRTPAFPEKALGSGSSTSWGFFVLVTLCEQFKVPATPRMLKHKPCGYADVDWLAPLVRVLGPAWVQTHVDITPTFLSMREYGQFVKPGDPPPSEDPRPAYVQLLVDHGLLDMTKDAEWSLEALARYSLANLRDMVTKLLPLIAPHRDKIPGCERFERIVRWLHKEKEAEQPMWPERRKY